MSQQGKVEKRPEGEALIDAGECPIGETSRMACYFCEMGHFDDCHHPMSCLEARCAYSNIKAVLDEYPD